MPALGGLTSGAAPHPEEQLEEEASGEGAVLTSNPSTTGIIGVLGLGSAITLVENAAASAAEKGNVDFGQTELRERQAFLLIAAEALLDFGAPSHRIEADLQHAARTLGVTAQFMHSPAVVIASFGSVSAFTSETHYVKLTGGGLDMGKLARVNHLWLSIEAGETTVQEGSLALQEMILQPPIYSTWKRVLLGGSLSMIICPLGFSGSFADACLAGFFGVVLTFLNLHYAARNPRFGDVFEISVATIFSFIARALEQTPHVFCYEASLSAGVVTVLPGFIILSGSLEIAGKSFVGGAVRLVYSMVYSLFLGFGIGAGSDLFQLVDRHARQDNLQVVTILQGFVNGTLPSDPFFNGTFTFDNSTTSPSTRSLDVGNINCIRADTDGWWARPASDLRWALLLVPLFAFCLCLASLQPINRRLPPMVVIACSGWVLNKVGQTYISNRTDTVSFLGAFTIGILSNVYSRITRGSSFLNAVTGVLFLVPSGIAAAGGLSLANRPHGADADDAYSHSLTIGFRMMQIAIGITVGLFFSSFICHLSSSARSRWNDHLRGFSF